MSVVYYEGNNDDSVNQHEDNDGEIILSADVQTDADEGTFLDDGEIEVKNEELYHPEIPTPSIQQILGRCSILQTRSKRNAQLHEEHVLHQYML